MLNEMWVSWVKDSEYVPISGINCCKTATRIFSDTINYYIIEINKLKKIINNIENKNIS